MGRGIEKKQGSGETKSAAWLWYALGSAVFARQTAILGKIGISGVESNLGTAIRTVVVLFSYLVFHEQLTKKSALGLAGITAGTLLMLL